MDDHKKSIIYSSKRTRLVLVFILTLALVLTMIPLSISDNKVDADTNKTINQSINTYKASDTFTNGADNSYVGVYNIILDERAPLHINISSKITSPTALNGTFDIELKNSEKTFYSLSKNDNGGAKDIKTDILNPGTYRLILTTNNTTKSWNRDYSLSVDTMGNLASSCFVDQGIIVRPYTGNPVDFIDSVRYGGTPSSPLLARGHEYSVGYSKGNVQVGTGIITIKGLGGFYGSFNSIKGKHLTYTIKPSKATIYKKKTTISSTRPAKRQLKIKWKKISSANYYQIKYRVKGTKKWKSKTVSGSKTSYTLKKLKKGKKYQYKVRGLQKLKGYTTYYSKYSKTKTSSKIK